MSAKLKLMAVVERKHAWLPRFLVVPSTLVASWGLRGTTVVEGTLNSVNIGRRTLKRWDDTRSFIDLPEPLCRRAKVDTGASVTLVLRIASERLPEELEQLLANDPAARAAWQHLTPSQQRMLREHVATAKQAATRERRAVRALLRCG